MDKLEREIMIDKEDRLILILSVKGCQDIYHAYLKRLADVVTDDTAFVDHINLIYHHGFRQHF